MTKRTSNQSDDPVQDEGPQLFLSAKEEFRRFASKAQIDSSAYQLAFADQNFLLRRELRPVRLQLELLKADLIQQELRIKSTVVIFGSARICEHSEAHKRLNDAKNALAASPDNHELKRAYEISRQLLEKSVYYEEALKLAKLITRESQSAEERDYVVVTGGGPGIMEAANRGAYDVGGKSIGLNIVLPKEQGPNPYISPELTFQFHYFAIRKMHFLIRARALIAFPGGYGTLDEIFEALTLMQTRKIERMPIILFGEQFWRKVINFDYMVEEGVIDEEDKLLFQYTDSIEVAWDVIKRFYEGK
jgi:uncharacterized protein (TIGR00730 family)